MMVAAFLFYPKAAYSVSHTLSSPIEHLFSIFSHANIFHLAGNIICLWLMKSRFRVAPALAVAFVCSFLPQWSLWGGTETACGFSGVLFAVAGMSWGEARQFRLMLRKCVIPLVVCGLFPNVNIFIHLYCLFAGYAVANLSNRDTYDSK